MRAMIVVHSLPIFLSLAVYCLLQAEQDKASKDHQIRNLNDEIAHQDELINKLNREKKQMQEMGQVSFSM